MSVLRKTLAIIVGLVAGMTAMMAIEFGVMQIYGSLPSDSDPEVMRAFIAKLPLAAILLVLLSHQTGSFVASAVAILIAGHRWLAGEVGLGILYLLAGIANLTMIPHPLWFAVVDLLLYIPAAIAGCYAAGSLVRG